MWEKGGSASAIQGTADALAYVKAANERRLGEYADWRLPTLEEGMSVMTPNKQGRAHLDPVFEMTAPFIWTADLRPANKRWLIYYADGHYGTENLSFHAYIRLVRNANE
jgi:hypothetical protein